MRSPPHRWPAALCLCGHVVTRVGFLLDTAGANPVAPMDATILGSIFTAATYAVALFHFRMFELVPVARWTLIEQMREGVLVLDSAQRVVDLNPAAERILGITGEQARGRAARDLLPLLPDPGQPPEAGSRAARDQPRPGGGRARQYAPQLSALQHRGGFRLGYLIVLHDVTDQREAAGAHRRAPAGPGHAPGAGPRGPGAARQPGPGAGLREDAGPGRPGAARPATSGGRPTPTSPSSSPSPRTPTPTCASTSSAPARTAGPGFLPSLQDYLRRFRANYGIAATLEASPELAGRAFEPMVGAQLLRIIQEALTNVRKHARARAVRIGLSVSDGQAEAVVQDDGEGFDPARLEARRRAPSGCASCASGPHEVGGTVEVYSAPGEGTRVVITVPLQGRAS